MTDRLYKRFEILSAIEIGAVIIIMLIFLSLLILNIYAAIAINWRNIFFIPLTLFIIFTPIYAYTHPSDEAFEYSENIWLTNQYNSIQKENRRLRKIIRHENTLKYVKIL